MLWSKKLFANTKIWLADTYVIFLTLTDLQWTSFTILSTARWQVTKESNFYFRKIFLMKFYGRNSAYRICALGDCRLVFTSDFWTLAMWLWRISVLSISLSRCNERFCARAVDRYLLYFFKSHMRRTKKHDF